MGHNAIAGKQPAYATQAAEIVANEAKPEAAPVNKPAAPHRGAPSGLSRNDHHARLQGESQAPLSKRLVHLFTGESDHDNRSISRDHRPITAWERRENLKTGAMYSVGAGSLVGMITGMASADAFTHQVVRELAPNGVPRQLLRAATWQGVAAGVAVGLTVAIVGTAAYSHYKNT